MIKIAYTCAAVPPDGITLSHQYYFGKDGKGYYFGVGKAITYADINYIKMLFTPVGTTWQDVLKKIK